MARNQNYSVEKGLTQEETFLTFIRVGLQVEQEKAHPLLTPAVKACWKILIIRK
jgi:hypothetical protein